MTPLITTPRLTLSRLSLADAPFILELLNSPAWLKYIGDRNVHSIEDAERYLRQKVLPGYENNGLAGWKVSLKGSRQAIGNCGFYQREFLDTPDLGFAFLPKYIGQGYGYESATGAIAYARDQLGLTKACAFTVDHNHASIALLRKLGFRQNGTINWPDDPEELLFFEREL